MSTPDWICPAADERGFVAFKVLKRHAAAQSRSQFLRHFPLPALHVIDDSNLTSVEPMMSVDRGVQLVTETIHGVAILKYLTRVAFVTKRPGNPFPHLVSIGRSHKNDIAIAVDSVSKVHGYFVSDESGWSFIDHGSTNGSQLNGKALAANARNALADGDLLQVGLGVCLEFLSPTSLYQKARSEILGNPHR